MAERKHGRPAPETTTEIRHEDWGRQDLTGQQHTAVAFIDVDFSETSNQGAVFTDCTFRGSRFNCSTHTDAAFVNCTFERCSLFEAAFTNCKLIGTMFDRCTFDLLSVEGGDWSFTGLPGADLRKASFRSVRMREVDLTGARCAGATLRDLDLSGAWLHSADLSRADLRGSDLSSVDPLTTELKRAVITWEQAVVLITTLGLDVRSG